VVSVGSINMSVVYPREVFKGAILSNAASVIFLHNHPSGDPTPSEEDIVSASPKGLTKLEISSESKF